VVAQGVAAARLSRNASILLIRYDDGWAFHGWTSMRLEPIRLHPEAAHLALRFPTLDEAVAFFREMYGERLDAGSSDGGGDD
jgi:hypothetical protein